MLQKVISASKRCRGFTLIELMITVAVLGVLAAIAYPSYTEYTRRGKVVEALGELSTLRVRLEQYYQDNRNYGSTATSCGVAMPTQPSFTFTCTWGADGTSQSFVVTATGKASAGMDGYVYTLDQANAQRTTMFAGTASSATCWLRKRGDAC